jgi:hypothetical protein
VNDLVATVRSWDPVSGGSAFRDDGTVVPLPPECLQDSVFRFLRSGQRVRLRLSDDPAHAVVGVELP